MHVNILIYGKEIRVSALFGFEYGRDDSPEKCRENLEPFFSRSYGVGKILKTPAEGDTVCETTYLNRIAKFQTSLDMETVQHILKQVEVENGRTAESKRTGIIPLDIDLLEFNGQVLKPEDMKKELRTPRHASYLRISVRLNGLYFHIPQARISYAVTFIVSHYFCR